MTPFRRIRWANDPDTSPPGSRLPEDHGPLAGGPARPRQEIDYKETVTDLEAARRLVAV